jgi:hypothetical protein
LPVKILPGKDFGEFDQGMLKVEERDQRGFEEVGLSRGMGGLWLHGFSQFLRFSTTLHSKINAKIYSQIKRQQIFK